MKKKTLIRKTVWIFAKSILIPVVVGALVGVIMSKYIDYEILKQPMFSPKNTVFPIVWTILYILMGISYGIIDYKGKTDKSFNILYYTQLGVNALWSIFFFILKWRFFSILWILLLDVLIIWLFIKLLKKDKLAGWLQLPYLLWCLFATYLTIGFYVLNNL